MAPGGGMLGAVFLRILPLQIGYLDEASPFVSDFCYNLRGNAVLPRNFLAGRSIDHTP
jgi:hypothetical protein